MAEIEYTDAVAGPESGHETGGLGRLINMAGALASLALIVGIGVWGYKLWVRDVSGVPVVRAIEGPMRVAPKDPGGEPADHQGLAVNAVAAQGSAAPVADQVRLAPRPTELADEDLPMGEEKKLAAGQGAEDDQVARTNASVDALVEQLVAGTKPLDFKDASDTGKIVQPAPLTPGATPEAEKTPVVTGPGVTRSLRPRARPATLVAMRADDIEEGDTLRYTGKVVDMDPDKIASGTRLAQLGAFDSADQARAEWDKLNLRFGDYLGDKSRVVQQASSGGRTFYRLRAMGFNDLSEARRFCAVLAADKAECIPVTTR